MDEKQVREIEKQFRIAALATAILLIIGIIFYHIVEKLKFIDALYFSVITLTTVGYGDITPKTDIGKLFTVIYVVAGIGILATFANLLLKRAVARHQPKNSK